ncbi:iron complex outermembrane receptor protein [Luteibacter rhizovicinus]|uniref:Iron complex outermembrane receptor protein n=1 Tax=Luteibacter rhizovicinus TaxID=242606 RepID=A0A4R3YLF0_9GAMM|nr:TonB-dependent receptor [Luteibacter rhizovicinus]TCV93407.1 iron complex outermembrane receptor protein [Luteibacter rhizovicinus]
MSIRQRKLAVCLRSILGNGTVLSLCFCASAMAQDQPATDAPKPAKVTKSAPASAEEKDAVALGNITVTSQSRTQEVQVVPIPVQIVTQKQIDALAATDLSKMNGYIPGLFVDGSQPTQPVYSLRGITVTDFGIGTDSPIGIYEDGVYTGKTGGALLTFNDIQRVEVLKGPQGTLFGRNSAGGAISVVTNEPEDDWEGKAKVRLGNYGTRYVDGVLNAPIAPDLAARFSFVDTQSNGWLRDTANGQHYNKNDDWGIRSQLRWNAPGDTKVRVSWEHEKLNQPARPAIGLVPVPAAPGVLPFPADPQTYLNPIDAPVYNDVKGNNERRTFDGVSLFVDHSFPFGDLSSITAYRHFSTFNLEDGDGTNQPYLYLDTNNIEQNTSWSQEFKLSGKNDLLDWVAGVSYYHDNARQDSQVNLLTDSIDTLLNNTGVAPGGLYGPLGAALGQPGLLLNNPWQENMINHGRYTAEALYGDVIWHLSDRLNLTTGLRFTRDEKNFSWYNPVRTATQLDATLAQLQALGIFDMPGVPPIETFQQNLEFASPIATNAPLAVKRSWNDFSPRVVLDYKLTPNMMLYGSVAKGYEAGGFNAQQVDAVYQPESVWNYEIGLKSYFPDYRLLFNASVYYYRYSNLQSLSLISNGNGALPLYEVTTSDQHAKGLELEAHWQATNALRFNLATTYTNATYQHYVDPQGVSLSGQAVGEPLWSAAAGAEYVWHDVASGDLNLTVQHAYRGKQRCNSDSAAQGQCLSTPAFTLGVAQNRTDLRIGWSSSRMPWSVALYANNVFNKRYVQSINNISASILGTPFAYITPPRTWGVEVGVDF